MTADDTDASSSSSSNSPRPKTFSAPAPTRAGEPPTHHIIFLPGNPGLIGWYETYLAHVAALLHAPPESNTNSSTSDVSSHSSIKPPPALDRISVFGTSLANFSDEPRGPPLGLQGQIEFAERAVGAYAEGVLAEEKQQQSSNPTSPPPSPQPLSIILIGHSVGTYITLELLRRQKAQSRSSPRYRITHALLLFPTVLHLARGPRVRHVAPLFAHVPFLPALVTGFARVVTTLLPRAALGWAVARVTGFPAGAVETAVGWLRSEMGVRESVEMVRDELREIAEDGWGSEVWGEEVRREEVGKGESSAKVVFYFGEKDGYVDDEVRDGLIAKRGRRLGVVEGEGDEGEEWRPLMLVDEGGMPHAFSIRYSEFAAKKTVEFIRGMLEEDA